MHGFAQYVCSILGWGCEAELWSGFSSTAPPALDPGLTNLISKSSPMPQLHSWKHTDNIIHIYTSKRLSHITWDDSKTGRRRHNEHQIIYSSA